MCVCVCVCVGVCVCICPCVCYFRQNRSYRSENEICKKIDVFRFWHLSSNGITAKIVLRDLDLNFQVQTLKWLFWQTKDVKCKNNCCHQLGSQVYPIEWRHCECYTSWPWPPFSRNFEVWMSRKRWWLAKMLKYDFYKGLHLPSNGTVMNVFLRDLVLNIQGQTFQVGLFWQVNVRKQQTILLPSDEKSGISRGISLLRMLYVINLDVHFQGHEFLNRSRTVRASDKFSNITLIEVDICHRIGPLRLLYFMTLT